MGSLCGASDQQKAAQGQEASTASTAQSILQTMQANYGTVFAEDQNILKSLQTAMQPIIQSQMLEAASLAPTIQAGPNQFGYTPEQEAAMRGQAMQDTALRSDQAVRSVDVQAATGRGSMIPSGAVSQLEAMTRQSALNENASLQTGITESGFQLGNEKYNQALSAEASLGDPLTRLAGSTSTVLGSGTQAGGALTGDVSAASGSAATAMEGADALQSASNAWLAPLTGLVGGAASSALGNPSLFGGGTPKPK
jgi:hypothetical protein